MSAEMFGAGAKLKVSEVGAVSLFAEMVNVHSLHGDTIRRDPDLTMNEDSVTAYTVLLGFVAPVPEFVDGALPNLTRGREPSVLTLEGGGDQLHMVTAKRFRSLRQNAVTTAAFAKVSKITHWVAFRSKVARSGWGAETPWPQYTGLGGVSWQM